MSALLRVLLSVILCLTVTAACGDDPGTTDDDATDDDATDDDATDDDATDDDATTEPADPYEILAFDNIRLSSVGSDEHFQSATTEIDLRDGPFRSVALIVELDSTCFPFESWNTNPPPEGQNWPADCDAFDRNFEFILDPPQEEGDPPGIELVRAISPFGGPMSFRVNLTDIANGRPGLHRLKTHISTWSDGAGLVSGSAGGWNVTARLNVVPGTLARAVLAVVPLWDGSQGAGDVGPRAFTAPAGTTSGRIEYRVTGHGGGTGDAACIGPAEEFCQREHTLFIDGVEVQTLVPWRDDCADLCRVEHYGSATGGFDYCAQNPCGAMSSVRAPRANWCPGSLTPPFTWDTAALGTPGEHTFEWRIAGVAAGGSWRVSAVYIAFGD